MYKLLVADDEQKDRNIVRLLVEKSNMGTCLRFWRPKAAPRL